MKIAENELPPSDRADYEAPAPAGTRAPKFKLQLAGTLREQLFELSRLNKWSNPVIGKKLDYSSSVISQYFNLTEDGQLSQPGSKYHDANGKVWEGGSKYNGDVDKLEKAISSLIRKEELKLLSGVATVDCDTSTQLAKALGMICQTNDVGEILAASGEGKTRGIEKFIENNPTTLLYRVRRWSRGVNDIEAWLFIELGSWGWKRGTNKTAFMAKMLKGTERLLIVDDAHKLTSAALQWFYDFHDETGIPIAFVGTFDLPEKLERDPQRASRTGLRFEIIPKNPRELINHLIKEIIPDVGGEFREIGDLCEELQKQKNTGSFRAVNKQLKLALAMKTQAPQKLPSWVIAFRAAHTQLVRHYKLN